jgi:hypothetical protein
MYRLVDVPIGRNSLLFPLVAYRVGVFILSSSPLKKEIGMRRTVLVLFSTAIALLLASAALAASNVGYRDFSFAASGVGGAATPMMAQSKLWFNDDLWWGVLFDRSSEGHHIYRYDWASHSWNDTGTLVDERNFSKASVDCWSGRWGRKLLHKICPSRSKKSRALQAGCRHLKSRTLSKVDSTDAVCGATYTLSVEKGLKAPLCGIQGASLG